MKAHTLFIALLVTALPLPAQSNEAVRLAVISESGDTSAAADVLTSEFSSHEGLQLLERNEIEKIYREQGMSAGNRDELKLGRILGADGLLLLGTSMEGTNQVLNARLVAIKPGVTLVAEKFSWPIMDLAGWSANYVKHLNPLLPKLGVLVKDAIPISVVNLRSAVQSSAAAETEKQLKLLTIQRLSSERQFFVLERQRMELLTPEKELKTDESLFWSGSYLLEGVVDQNGYSPDTVTINGRLTPSKVGAPLLFEVKGSRTNLAEVVNQMAWKVTGLLQIKTSAADWNAADEAARYLAEARWAIRWGAYKEAQSAAESAWALGKHDLDCALVRIRAYTEEVPALDSPGVLHVSKGRPDARYVNIAQPPDARHCEDAINALRYYYDFSRGSADGVPAVLWKGKGWNDWHNSEWYQSGLDSLQAASYVLQHYNYLPDLQKPVADKLAALRSLSRTVAELISQAPSVHDGYFVGNRPAERDELDHTICEHPNIFRCKVNWGCFWQEKPEDAIAMYRELMSSPVFAYIHKDFWLRPDGQPRLAAWNENDRRRIPELWKGFVRELDSSTNVLLRLEAKALTLVDARDDGTITEAYTNFFGAVLENREALVTNPVEVMYLNWGADDLVRGIDDGAGRSELKESLEHRFYSDYRPKLEAMDAEYWSKTYPAAQAAAEAAEVFPKQKQYLKEFRPFELQEFVHLFTFQSDKLSKNQALELLPLLAAYKSNLPTNSNNTTRTANAYISMLQFDLQRIINPPAPPPLTPAPLAASKPIVHPRPVAVSAAKPPPTNAPEAVSNILSVKQFIHIPLEGLPGDDIGDAVFTGHHWMEGRLVLDFRYGAFVYSFDRNGNWQGTQGAGLKAVGLVDPHTGQWQIAPLPRREYSFLNNGYCGTAFFHGELYKSSDGEIKRYDFPAKQWVKLPVSDGNDYELYSVNDHLYAAGNEIIFEIMDGGKSTRILASNRRQPPVSALDAQDLGKPILFAGPDNSLRVATRSKICAWDATDWREVSALPQSRFGPEVFAEGLFFRQGPEFPGAGVPAVASFLPTESNQVALTFWYRTESNRKITVIGSPGLPPTTSATGETFWKMPPNLSLPDLPAAWHGPDLCLLVEHSELKPIVDEQQHVVVGEKVLPRDGYNAKLLYFSHELPQPQKIYLKFDSADGYPPVTGQDPSKPAFPPVSLKGWMAFAGDLLIFGLEDRNSTLEGGRGEQKSPEQKAGIWVLPVSELEAAVAEQKQAQLRQMAEAAAAVEQARKSFLAKYDLNHNGIIDPQEKEEALDDPAYIESQLDVIDANHNGWLDANELAYFDANTNKTLDPKEQAGINIAEHLLAERLMRKFDSMADGLLDEAEFNDLFQSAFAMGHPEIRYQFPDDNHDGRIDLGELESFLTEQTRHGLHFGGAGARAFLNQLSGDGNQLPDRQHIYKASVEFYWQHPGMTNADPPPRRRGTAGGGGIQ